MSRKRVPPKLRFRVFRCLDVQCNRLPSNRSPASHLRHIQASGEWHAESVGRAKRSAVSMGAVPLPDGCRMSRESVQAVAESDVGPEIDPPPQGKRRCRGARSVYETARGGATMPSAAPIRIVVGSLGRAGQDGRV